MLPRCFKEKDEELFKVRNGKSLGVCTECYDLHYAPLVKDEAHHKQTTRAANKRKRVKDVTRGRKVLLDYLSLARLAWTVVGTTTL